MKASLPGILNKGKCATYAVNVTFAYRYNGKVALIALGPYCDALATHPISAKVTCSYQNSGKANPGEASVTAKLSVDFSVDEFGVKAGTSFDVIIAILISVQGKVTVLPIMSAIPQ